MEMSYHVAFADTFHMMSARWRERMERIISSIPTCTLYSVHSFTPFSFVVYIFTRTIGNGAIANGSAFIDPILLAYFITHVYEILENWFQRHNRYDINAPAINIHGACVGIDIV